MHTYAQDSLKVLAYSDCESRAHRSGWGRCSRETHTRHARSKTEVRARTHTHPHARLLTSTTMFLRKRQLTRTHDRASPPACLHARRTAGGTARTQAGT
eukprot:2047867-Pleurochrysis_carterae.AAC.1